MIWAEIGGWRSYNDIGNRSSCFGIGVLPFDILV
jgi:hypothetical protein